MNVFILSDCWAEGRHLRSGEITSLSEATARELISIERAELAPEQPPAGEPSNPEQPPAPKPGRESKPKPKE